MMRKIAFLLLLLSVSILAADITEKNGYVFSSVRILGEIAESADPVFTARSIIASELSDYFHPSIIKDVMEYISSIPEWKREDYEKALENFRWAIPTNAIVYSETEQRGTITITGKLPSEFSSSVSGLFISSLDKEAEAIENRRNEIKKRIADALIDGAPNDINTKLAMAAYYAYEYENGRIEEDRSAKSVDEMIASLNLKNPYLEAYMLAAGKQVEKASEEVKDTVLTAAMLKYLYLLMD